MLDEIAERALADVEPRFAPSFELRRWSTDREVGVFFYDPAHVDLADNVLGTDDSLTFGVFLLGSDHSDPIEFRIMDATLMAGDIVQDLTVIRRFEVGADPTWPPCPRHHGLHPLRLDVVNNYDDVAWVCGQPSRERPEWDIVASLGGLSL